jgi:hypothetical protein
VAAATAIRSDSFIAATITRFGADIQHLSSRIRSRGE